MRLELSKRTDLAIRAVAVLCNGQGDLIAGSIIAGEIGTTTNFLPQVMTPLVREGWVDSTRGPSGGYRLVVPHSEIALLDLIEAVEGPTANGRCVLRGSECSVADECALHEPWMRAREAMLGELARTRVLEVGCSAHERSAYLGQKA